MRYSLPIGATPEMAFEFVKEYLDSSMQHWKAYKCTVAVQITALQRPEQ
jgi:hypothetical protein